MLRQFSFIIMATVLLVTLGSGCGAPTPPPSAPQYPNLPSILESLAPVANGQGVTQARAYTPEQSKSPKLVILDNSTPRIYSGGYQNWNWKLPADWLPASLDETDLVVVVKEQEVDLGSRNYTAGPAITRYRWDLEVLVRTAYSGDILASVILKGPDPADFPPTAPLETNRMDGTSVSLAQLEDWLASSPELKGQLEATSPLRTLNESAHTGNVTSIAFSPDGELLASGSEDNTIRLWHVKDGAILHTLNGHTSAIKSVIFSPDEETLVSMSYDDVKIWRVEDGLLLRTLEVLGSNSQVTISPNGDLLALGRYDTVQIWRIVDGVLQDTLKDHSHVVDSVAFSPDGEMLASGCEDNTVRLWRVKDGKLIRTIKGFKGYSGPVRGLAFSPDGQMLASADPFNVWFWKIEDGELLLSLKIHAPAFHGNSTLSFSPNGMILASGAKDSNGSVQLWRVKDGAFLRTLKGRINLAGSVAFSPDGKMLATGTENGTVLLWQIEPDSD